MAYWYNVSNGRVERDGETDPKGNLMGPYATEQEAQQALETARARTEAWDAEDAKDKEWEGED
ncbi:methionine aminopeptidase [Dermacoccaceae bacterium W4C1]